MPLTRESNQTLQCGCSEHVTVASRELSGKLEEVVLILPNKRANRFSERILHKFSGHEQGQGDPFFPESDLRDPGTDLSQLVLVAGSDSIGDQARPRAPEKMEGTRADRGAGGRSRLWGETGMEAGGSPDSRGSESCPPTHKPAILVYTWERGAGHFVPRHLDHPPHNHSPTPTSPHLSVFNT